MKHSDFKKSLSKLPPESIIKDQVYTIKIPSERLEINYDLLGLHKFAQEQYEEWNQANKSHPRFRDSINFFNKLLNTVENIVTYTTPHPADVHRDIVRQLHNIKSNILLCNSPKTLFLVKLKEKYPDYFDGAFDTLTDSIQSGNIYTKNYLRGIILATNFETEDFQPLSLKDGEDLSFTELRNKFQQDNNESRINFVELFNDVSKSSNDEIASLKKLQEEWNNNLSKTYQEWVSKADDAMKKSESTATRLLKKSLQTKIELEQTYREQMKFQVPAEYWRQRATELNKEGHKFMYWLIGLVVTGASMLFILLWLCPEDMLISIFSREPVRAIRWSIIFITFISFLFFGIQAVKKAMFSCFHLARDAEEREKLTVFYLSLIKDTTITQEDRSLVLQSLFSRAETGMLKDDGNPTMPGLFDKIKG